MTFQTNEYQNVMVSSET